MILKTPCTLIERGDCVQVSGVVERDKDSAAPRIEDWPLARSGLRGNDRYPKGRDAQRLGCAPGAGERDPTSGRGPPKPADMSFAEYRKDRMSNEPGLCAATIPSAFGGTSTVTGSAPDWGKMTRTCRSYNSKDHRAASSRWLPCELHGVLAQY